MEAELKFDWWVRHYGRMFEPDFDLDKPSAFVLERAIHSHVLAVFNPLGDLIGGAVRAASSLSEQQARYYLLYGAARRYQMIWESYRSIIGIAPFDRKEPLSRKETQETNRDLNLLYINLRGVLDNLAWSCLFERCPETARELDTEEGRRRVGLYSGKLQSINGLGNLHKTIASFREWYFSVPTRRDPSTHRIPLTIPTIASESEADEWQRLVAESEDAFRNVDLDAIGRAHKAAERVGRFEPIFVHNPADGAIPLYPTIPEDMANLIMISQATFTFLGSKNGKN